MFGRMDDDANVMLIINSTVPEDKKTAGHNGITLPVYYTVTNC